MADPLNMPHPEEKSMYGTIYKYVLYLRNRHFLILDTVIICLSPALALLLRFEKLSGVTQHAAGLAIYTLVSLSIRLVCFYRMGFYRRYWRYASVDEIAILSQTMLATFVLCVLVFFGLSEFTGVFSPPLPRSLPFVDSALVAMIIGGVRFAIRLAYVFNERIGTREGSKDVLIVGAGIAGSMIATELRANPAAGMKPVGFVDDDPSKQRMEIRGIKVLGRLKDIPRIVNELRIGEIIIAMPTASGKVIRNILQVCKLLKINSKTIPGVFEILSGSAVAQLREIRIEDLLRREPVEIDTKNVELMIRGSRVMVTGAGGSIGSELCRQIASFRPAELVMLGHGEDSIFRIASEMRTKHGIIIGKVVKFRTVIADIRNAQRMNQIFQKYRPQIVFHAAAHKHVGLMQKNISDAVTNNVLGTQILVDLAARNAVEKFVMISSDKAVNPASVMGVTKRVAELVVHDAAVHSGKAFVTVRFGNVLGSRGSVVPILKNQIQEGGPVKITHPDVVRFFMTIPEAVQLVLQAGAMATCGETYVLDMGKPIKIVDLARDLIRLGGLREGIDIDIVFTGLQQGEKIQEELFYQNELAEHSDHEKIFVCKNGKSLPQNGNGSQEEVTSQEGIDLTGGNQAIRKNNHSFRYNILHLVAAAQMGNLELIHNLLSKIVPEYISPLGEMKQLEPGNGKPGPDSARVLVLEQEHLNSAEPGRYAGTGQT